MEKFIELMPVLLGALVLIIIWFVLRRLMKSLSDRINNNELYKEDMLNVLEEIRDELKDLNKNNFGGKL